MLRPTFSLPPRPKPLDALIYAFNSLVDVTFDIPLTLVILANAANWTVNMTGDNYPVLLASAGVAGPNIVQLTLAASVPNPGPDVVSYDPPPYDVTGVLGQAALPFAGFPLHP